MEEAKVLYMYEFQGKTHISRFRPFQFCAAEKETREKMKEKGEFTFRAQIGYFCLS